MGDNDLIKGIRAPALLMGLSVAACVVGQATQCGSRTPLDLEEEIRIEADTDVGQADAVPQTKYEARYNPAALDITTSYAQKHGYDSQD